MFVSYASDFTFDVGYTITAIVAVREVFGLPSSGYVLIAYIALDVHGIVDGISDSRHK